MKGPLPKGRLEAFSDGVIAIVITLLVLEIKIPELHTHQPGSAALIEALKHLVPKILSWVVSFAFVAIWWVAHHQLFHIIVKSNRGLLWLNSLFLLCLSFLPFPTALMGEYPTEPVASMIFGATATLTGLSFLLMRWYVCFYARLADPSIPKTVLRQGLIRGVVSPVLYFLSTLTALYRPIIAMILFALIPLYYVLPSLIDRHLHSDTLQPQQGK